MKQRLLAPPLLISALVCLATPSYAASTKYWTTASCATIGGTGTWDTTSSQWSPNSTGGGCGVWVNANSDSAYFGGTVAYTNTISGNKTVNKIIVANVSKLQFEGSVTVAFKGTDCGIDVASSIYVPFYPNYSGTLTKTGPGRLTLQNSNTGSKFVLRGGMVTIDAVNRLGTYTGSDLITFDGGGLGCSTATADIPSNKGFVVADGGAYFGASNGGNDWLIESPILAAAGATNGGITATTGLPLYSPYNAGCSLALSNKTATLNNYKGPTVVVGATIKLGAANQIPDDSVLTFTNGTINFAGFNDTVKSITGTSGTLTLGAGDVTFANPEGDTFAGIITGTTSSALIKNGTGLLTLAGNNTYSGPTTVNAGTLEFSGGNTCIGLATVNTNGTLKLSNPNTLPSAPIAVNSGGILDLGNADQTLAALSGAGMVIGNDGHTLTVNGTANTAAIFGQYSCYSGAITNGSLVKDGTHAMALRGTNSFENGTISFANSAAAGTLSVGAAPNRIPVTTGLGVPAGATFQLDASSQTLGSLFDTNSTAGNLNLGGGTLIVKEAALSTFSGLIRDSDLPGTPTAPGHGLRGYYYDNIDMTALMAVRDDASINFTNFLVTNDMALPDAGIIGTNFSVRWVGKLLAPASGTYTFSMTCDDGKRLWVDGKLVVDGWVSGSGTKSGTIALVANTQYEIVAEYFQGSSAASAKLLWTPPGDLTSVIIPAERLFLPGPGALVMGGSGQWNVGNSTTPNTYSGDTLVYAGTLGAQYDGALGKGNVTVSNASLTLASGTLNTYISSSANLLLKGASAVVNLNFTGTNLIRGISFDGGATFGAAGTWGPTGSGVAHQSAQLAGTGFLEVAGAPSAITLISSGTPAVYGSPVNLTATVTPSGATGTVTYYDGAFWLGSATLNGSGVAVLSVSNLTVGVSHSITASYSGDATHAARTSAAVTQATTAAPLTPNVVIATRAYDGTTNATIASTTFAGILDLDTNYVRLDGTAVANFRDKNVGVGKPVDITGLALAGSLSANYSLAGGTSLTTTGTITNRIVTVSGLSATNRPYNATLSENTTGTPTLNNVVSPDVVTPAGTAVLSFLTKEIGTNKPVTVTGLTLSGADAANYTLSLTNLAATITAAPITVSGLSVVTKVYDGTTPATLSGTAALSPTPFGTDDVTLGGTPVANFNNKTVGNAKPVTVSGYVITGNDSTNYSLSQPGLSGNITIDSTTCVVTSSVNPSTNGQNVTFTATVHGVVVAADSPTGSVVFYVDDSLVGAPSVVAAGANTATATYSTASLSDGAHTVKAQYGGDVNFALSAMSTIVTQTVGGASSPVTISRITTTAIDYTAGSGSKFILLESAVPTTARSTWTGVATNTSTPGSFPISTGTGKKFYSIKSE
jgi:autotransporter-associated beta strand protein